MKRGDILRIPVSDLKSPRILGHVTELALRGEEMSVAGFYVRLRGARKSLGYVPMASVVSLGPSIILFSGRMQGAKAYQPIEQSCMMDLQGAFLGRPADLDFDVNSGRVRAFWMKRSLTETPVELLGDAEVQIRLTADGHFLVTSSLPQSE